MKKDDDTDNCIDDDFDFENEKLVLEHSVKNTIYTIFIDDTITHANKYRKIYYKIKNAKKHDIITLVINTFGGYLYTFIELYSVLMKTKAKTIAEIHTADSAGSLLALSCDDIEINEFAEMMIHTASFGAYGKVEEIKSRVIFEDKRTKKIISKLYKGFLTDMEIQKVLDGKDYYFDADQIKKRLKNWTPIRKRK
jgi:ATP-dependent protease ClpP protease subunit